MSNSVFLARILNLQKSPSFTMISPPGKRKRDTDNSVIVGSIVYGYTTNGALTVEPKSIWIKRFCPKVEEQSCPRLNDFCLNAIMTNFEKLMTAYSAVAEFPKNYFLKRHFEFLQRTSSKVLFDVFSTRSCFFKYVEFLINPFLKEIELDMSELTKAEMLLIIEQIKSVGSTVTKLHLSGYLPVHLVLDLIPHLNCVKSLAFCNTSVPETVFKAIAKFCTSLQSLNVGCCTNVTDTELQRLCADDDITASYEELEKPIHKNLVLQHLDVRCTSVTHVGIAFILRHFPNILSLEHEGLAEAIYDCCANHDTSLTKSQLETYNFTKFKVPLQSQCELGTLSVLCPYITSLEISVKCQREIDICTRLTKLKDITFHLYDPVDLSLFIKAKGSSLTTLCIVYHRSTGPISLQQLLRYCLNLEVLSLIGITFELLSELEDEVQNYTFQHLKRLALSEIDFNFKVVRDSVNLILSCSPNLNVLELFHVKGLKPRIINPVVIHNYITNIQEILIEDADVDFFYAKKLLSMAPKLKKYTLKKCILIQRKDIIAIHKFRPSMKLMYEPAEEVRPSHGTEYW